MSAALRCVKPAASTLPVVSRDDKLADSFPGMLYWAAVEP
jgi:hypothetical protein